MAAKRVATGIWHCSKCKAKFTGKAYDVAKKIRIKEEVVEGAAEEKKKGKEEETEDLEEN
jgi:ribosomal protein L37AE/L43A